ncbi:ubiquitin-like protein [Jaminaea rosea]|uniref:Ubiquitin-like protein n=1 Tax=Jaminaea rosea TaxID=1569628 RepID=A0A316V399_9BASI|nr:ubiquitin-like protein [Jaminaea rosea]PWN31011.1 ubiquitin-like protein [Jaminaea rosea]
MSDHEENAPKPEPEQLNIKVKDSDGNEVFFKVKKHTKLAKLQKAYAERMGKPFTSIRFVFDGQRINDEDTADSMGMEDGDEIDALPEQLGGCN